MDTNNKNLLLDVKNLSIKFKQRDGENTAVDRVSFELAEGDALGIVGESGSGKTVLCQSLMGLINFSSAKVTGEANYQVGNKSRTAYKDHPKNLLKLSPKQLQALRAYEIGMVFQDPMTTLNPYLHIGEQLSEVLRWHPLAERKTKTETKQSVLKGLREVGVPDVELIYKQYPHQLSGGLKQRVIVAMALLLSPNLLIADEPTTALDVTVQKQILDLLIRLKEQRNLTLIFISHDLNVVKYLCDKVLVMHKGAKVEYGETARVFELPRDYYTQQLIAASPKTAKPQQHTVSSLALNTHSTLLNVFDISKNFLFKGKAKKAVDNVSFNIKRGEILGLVGESGCGKTTISKLISRIDNVDQGEILFNEQAIQNLSNTDFQPYRKDIQMIFQDPYSSLNPRMTVFDILAEPIKLYEKNTKTKKNKTILLARVLKLMDEVGLMQDSVNKYPHQFSGGQRQRIAIAKALAVEPSLLIADEPVSALDVTVQAQILELLLELSAKRQMTMLFISHDLDVVRYMADRVAIMCDGKIVEIGNTESVYLQPEHSFTQNLFSSKL